MAKQAIDPGTHELRDVTENDVVWNGKIVGTVPTKIQTFVHRCCARRRLATLASVMPPSK